MATEKRIIIVVPGSLSAKDKDKLSKNGLLVIEHPDPPAVRIITPSISADKISGNDIMMSAMYAMSKTESTYGDTAKLFVKTLNARLIESETDKDNDNSEMSSFSVKEFAERISKGHKLTSKMDLQFYENNKTEIEAALVEKKDSC